VKNRRN